MMSAGMVVMWLRFEEAGAEIVQRHVGADFAHRLQLRVDAFGPSDQRAFGEFQLDEARVDVVF